MNFTRDPIIETVITPREGCKLVVRNSKVANQESFLVEALEVVSFGHSLFFRSQERPKSFLVPVSDYEITESKEAKMVLKNASPDQSIKIGGGRETPPRREVSPESSEEQQNERPAPEHQERKRDKRRRGRRGRDRGEYAPQHQSEQQSQQRAEPAEAPELEPVESEAKEKAPTTFISKLFPPPSTLIKETIGRYKTAEPAPEDLDMQGSDRPEIPFSEDETIDEQ